MAPVTVTTMIRWTSWQRGEGEQSADIPAVHDLGSGHRRLLFHRRVRSCRDLHHLWHFQLRSGRNRNARRLHLLAVPVGLELAGAARSAHGPWCSCPALGRGSLSSSHEEPSGHFRGHKDHRAHRRDARFPSARHMGLEPVLKHASSVPEVLWPECICALRFAQGVVARNHCVCHRYRNRRWDPLALRAHPFRRRNASSCRRSRVAATQWRSPRATRHDFLGRRFLPRRSCRHPHPADDWFSNERRSAHPSCDRCVRCGDVRSPPKPPAHLRWGPRHWSYDDVCHRLLPEQVDMVEFVP
ncbi:unannotated protein [freshwater metagenome]|uniref:Unannotated protein n=1 Tax=freshwater metagenome TaxID=449393 RepID=A0A6J7ILN5_9ZZZZ